jgi:hypothetical protein
MSKIIHLCADIRGLLENNTRRGSLNNTLIDDDGRKLTHDEARDYLYECLGKGWKVIPFGDCDNFDYQTGCKGHEVKEVEGK